MGGVSGHKRSDQPRVVRTPQVINAVRSIINRNSVRKQEILAQERDIAPRTMNRLIKLDLGLRAFKRQTGQRLTVALKENREKKSRRLLSEVKNVTKKSSLQIKLYYNSGTLLM
jgi:hypothetical protein